MMTLRFTGIRRLFIALCTFISVACTAFADNGLIPVPPLTGRVVDLAEALPTTDEAILNARLEQLEKDKGSQIAVLIVPTTQPEAIEQFSLRVVERWKLGRKKVDDGVLLLIAMQDRAFRMEVGYGLEGALPDATAKKILEEILKPYLREGDVGGGVKAAVDAMIKVVNGEPLPPPAQVYSSANFDDGMNKALPIVFVGLFLSMLFSFSLGKVKGAGVAAVVCGLGAIYFIGAFLSAICALFIFLIGGFGQSGSYRTGGGHSGGWSSGGGGFSGGGGSFGGGGASGRW